MGLAKVIGKRQDFDQPSVESYLLLLRVTDLLERRMAEVLKAESLTGAQYNVLRILRGNARPCTCSEIGSQMVVQDPDVTRLIDRMEKRWLIERCRCTEDRRVVWIKLTEAGAQVLDRLEGPVRERHDANFASISRDDLIGLIRVLTQLMES